MKNRDELMTYLYQATDIPFYICNVRSHISFTHSKIILEELFYYVLSRFQRKGCDAMHPFLLNEGDIFFCGMIQLNENAYFMLGPVCPTRYLDEYLKAQLSDIVHQQLSETLEILKYGPVVTLNNLKNTMCLASRIMASASFSIDDIYLEEHEPKSVAIQKNLINMEYQKGDKDDTTLPRGYEQYFLDAIRNGDPVSLQMFQQRPAKGVIGTMSKNSIRQQRYIFVVAATLMCRAAIEGGLLPEKAFSVCDIYCQKMDEYPDGTDFSSLYISLMNTYIDSVNALKKQGKYSAPVIQMRDYIASHLQQPISMEDLSACCGFSVHWAGRRFAEETGMSVNQYIHRCRLERACQMLKYTDFSISEISNTLQYSSQSYFTEQFKKQYNVTPKKYREQSV